MPKKYIIIPRLGLLYPSSDIDNTVGWELVRIQTSFGLAELQYDTLEQALKADKLQFKNILNTAGIIEIELGNETLSAILDSLSKAKNKEEVIKPLLKSIQIGDFQIPAEFFSLPACEAEHLKQLKNDDHEIQLAEPPLLFLNKLDPKLRFLYFMDYKFFDYALQNWQHWENREPGSMSDLFLTAATKFYDYLNSKDKPFITLDHIQNIHASVSKNIEKSGVALKGGVFREGYNAVPLSPNTITLAGIKDLLLRIKKDNNPQGFMIGEMIDLQIGHRFFNKMYYLIHDALHFPKDQPLPPYSDKDNFWKTFDEIKNTAIAMVAANISDKNIDSQVITSMIDELFKEYKIKEAIIELGEDKSSTFTTWGKLKYLFEDLENKSRSLPTKSEYIFTMNNSRKNAIASIHSPEVINDHLDNLAEIICKQIKEGKKIYIFPPEIQTAIKTAQQAIDDYNKSILDAKTPDEKIKLIGDLFHVIEICHLFNDANLRTCCLAQNETLLANGLVMTMLYDPFRMHGLNSEERQKQIKEGMHRVLYILSHQKEILEKNDKIIHLLLMLQMDTNWGVSFSPELANKHTSLLQASFLEITKPFDDKLQAYSQTFSTTIDFFIAKYKSNPTPHFFSNKEPTSDYNQFVNALEKLKSSHDFISFNKTVNSLEHSEDSSDEMKNDISKIKALAGYNEGWAGIADFSPQSLPSLEK